MNTSLNSTLPSFLTNSEDNNLDVSAASYLGGSGDDSARAVDISLDGQTVIIGGDAPNHSPGGKQISLLGGGEGILVRYDSQTNQVLSSTRLPGQVRDLEVNSQTGEIAIAYGSGMAVLSADASSVIWRKSLINADRIAISGMGNVAVLQENATGSADKITLYSNTGQPLQEWSSNSGSRNFRDVAISDKAGGAVVITGFKQARANLQIAFTQAWTYDGKARWTNYDYSSKEVDAVNLLADTRGERVAFGRDGKLYSANWINGGTGYSIFSREPADLSQKASQKTVVTDEYTNAYNTGTVAMTWFGEYDLKTGGLVKGQSLLTRRSRGQGNSITPDAITADEHGNIYLSGKASASLKDRSSQKIEGQLVSGYGASDGFLAIISPDLKTRYAWTPISQAEGTAVAARNGVAAVVTTTYFEGTQITDNPIQSKAGGGKDGYFLILGGKDVPVGSSPVPQPTPIPTPPTPSVNDNGLKAEYYNNTDFTSLALTRTDANINFDWGIGSPAANIGADTFSARWIGQVQPLHSETYTFHTTTDDGIRLWVNSQLIIDKFIDQAPTEYRGSIALVAGQKYDIRMDYYEKGGGAVAQLAWSSASQNKEIIPQSQLFSSTTTTGGGTTTPPTTPEPSIGSHSPIRIEAESLKLSGYRAESAKSARASGDQVISLKASGAKQGTAQGVFQGLQGLYQIQVGYYDENDGLSAASFSIGGKTKSWVFDQTLPSNATSVDNRASQIVDTMLLKPGDAFTLTGQVESGEYARFDYVDFMQVGSAAQPVWMQSDVLGQKSAAENLVVTGLTSSSFTDQMAGSNSSIF